MIVVVTLRVTTCHHAERDGYIGCGCEAALGKHGSYCGCSGKTPLPGTASSTRSREKPSDSACTSSPDRCREFKLLRDSRSPSKTARRRSFFRHRRVAAFADPSRLAFESLESRLVLTQVGIPLDPVGEPGGKVVVPVNVVDDAGGAVAVDIEIAYDTTLLDTTPGQITAGSLWPGVGVTANVNDGLGTIVIEIYSTTVPLGAGPGSIVNVEFDISGAAPAGPTTIDLKKVELDETPADPAPQPGADSTDGQITVEIPVVGHVDVTLVDPPTEIVDTVRGEVAALPENLVWIDEWEEFSLEIWVSNPLAGTVGVQDSELWLHYNAAYFTATQVTFGPAFEANQPPQIDVDGGRVFVDASTALSQVGDDQPALLARVLLEPIAGADNPGVPHDSTDDYVLPVTDLNVSVQDATVTLTNANSGDPELGQMPVPEVWPVMFDPDDDGRVTLGDLSRIAVAFNESIGDAFFNYQVDFDRSGRVDLGDLSWLAVNFGRRKDDALGPSYTSSPMFPDAWRPETLKLSSVQSAPQRSQGVVDADSGAQSAPYELSDAELRPIVAAAVSRLKTSDPDAAAGLGEVKFEIADLPTSVLGLTYGNTVQIDVDAAGQGWFVDATPWDDTEFVAMDGSREVMIAANGNASQPVDLLTVVLHELGHVLGYEHEDGGFMDETLLPGTRRLPMGDAVDEVFASFDESP